MFLLFGLTRAVLVWNISVCDYLVQVIMFLYSLNPCAVQLCSPEYPMCFTFRLYMNSATVAKLLMYQRLQNQNDVLLFETTDVWSVQKLFCAASF